MIERMLPLFSYSKGKGINEYKNYMGIREDVRQDSDQKGIRNNNDQNLRSAMCISAKERGVQYLILSRSLKNVWIRERNFIVHLLAYDKIYRENYGTLPKYGVEDWLLNTIEAVLL